MAEVTPGILERLSGASGTRTIFAPLPISDEEEGPYIFDAIILAQTERPRVKE